MNNMNYAIVNWLPVLGAMTMLAGVVSVQSPSTRACAWQRWEQILTSVRHHDNPYGDGTPFLWMGDTAWAVPMRSSDDEWNTCLADRHAMPARLSGGNGMVHPVSQSISAERHQS